MKFKSVFLLGSLISSAPIEKYVLLLLLFRRLFLTSWYLRTIQLNKIYKILEQKTDWMLLMAGLTLFTASCLTILLFTIFVFFF